MPRAGLARRAPLARRAALALLAACGPLAGCGGSSPGQAAPGATAATLFRQACGACHSLDGRPEPSHQGGDLLGYRFGRAALLEFAREMPVRRALDARQLASVVDYVARAERGRRAP